MMTDRRTHDRRDDDYSKREIDTTVREINGKLDLVIAQTTKTNGRVTRIERILVITAAVLVTVLFLKWPQAAAFITHFI